MAAKTNTPHTMDQFSAGRPIAGFNQTRTGFWIGVSLVLHMILIGATSVDYIRDTYIDPEGAPARHAKALEAEKGPPTTQPEATTKPATTQKATKTATGGADAQMLEAHKDAPVVKATTDTAKPGDIPSKPDDLGISLDDTNGGKK